MRLQSLQNLHTCLMVQRNGMYTGRALSSISVFPPCIFIFPKITSFRLVLPVFSSSFHSKVGTAIPAQPRCSNFDCRFLFAAIVATGSIFPEKDRCIVILRQENKKESKMRPVEFATWSSQKIS